MRQGIDPTRRNRNIGTAKQGHGSDNEFKIPESWHQDRVYYECLKDPVIIQRQILDREITFLVEPPRRDAYYPCTIDDVAAVLELLPKEHIEDLVTLVFRQPTRKEELWQAVWGRLVYWADLGKYEGVAIYLESQPTHNSYRHPLSQDSLGMAEIESLRQDGHRVLQCRRHFAVNSTSEATRKTQLFRTVAHEVGHLVHYHEAIDQGIDPSSRSILEEEQYAEAYAAAFVEKHTKAGALPFPPRIDEEGMQAEGLDPSWFVAKGRS